MHSKYEHHSLSTLEAWKLEAGGRRVLVILPKNTDEAVLERKYTIDHQDSPIVSFKHASGSIASR